MVQRLVLRTVGGLLEAMIVQQLHYWTQRYNRRVHGTTYNILARHFFGTPEARSKVRRAVANLVKTGVVENLSVSNLDLSLKYLQLYDLMKSKALGEEKLIAQVREELGYFPVGDYDQILQTILTPWWEDLPILSEMPTATVHVEVSSEHLETNANRGSMLAALSRQRKGLDPL